MRKISHSLKLLLLIGLNTLSCAQAADAQIYDETSQVRAVHYHLPSGWRGNGGVQWTTDAPLSGNVCVRHLSLEQSKLGLKGYTISSFEIPIKNMGNKPEQLASLLEPMLKQYFGDQYADIKLSHTQFAGVQSSLADSYTSRDKIREKLDHKVDSQVYHLTATFTATQNGEAREIVLGAISHERKLVESNFSKAAQSVTFHDVTMIAGKPSDISKELPALRDNLSTPHFTPNWTNQFIKHIAHAYDGMTQIDPKAMPLLRVRVEQVMAASLHAVLHSMVLHHDPQ